MSKPALKIFQSHDSTDRRERELDRIAGAAEPKTVAVPLGKVVPLLMDAVANDRAWLNDLRMTRYGLMPTCMTFCWHISKYKVVLPERMKRCDV